MAVSLRPGGHRCGLEPGVLRRYSCGSTWPGSVIVNVEADLARTLDHLDPEPGGGERLPSLVRQGCLQVSGESLYVHDALSALVAKLNRDRLPGVVDLLAWGALGVALAVDEPTQRRTRVPGSNLVLGGAEVHSLG